jgi:hypothetical protein
MRESWMLVAVLAVPFFVAGQARQETTEETFSRLAGKQEPRTGLCSIPLTELRPHVIPKMPNFAPKSQSGHMRFVKPPAPPCNQRESDAFSRATPKPERKPAPPVSKP